jgi:hypothetical protein
MTKSGLLILERLARQRDDLMTDDRTRKLAGAVNQSPRTLGSGETHPEQGEGK